MSRDNHKNKKPATPFSYTSYTDERGTVHQSFTGSVSNIAIGGRYASTSYQEEMTDDSDSWSDSEDGYVDQHVTFHGPIHSAAFGGRNANVSYSNTTSYDSHPKSKEHYPSTSASRGYHHTSSSEKVNQTISFNGDSSGVTVSARDAYVSNSFSNADISFTTSHTKKPHHKGQFTTISAENIHKKTSIVEEEVSSEDTSSTHSYTVGDFMGDIFNFIVGFSGANAYLPDIAE